MNKVFLAIPTLGSLDAHLVVNLLNWKEQVARISFTFGEKPVEKARNTLVREFLMTDCTHLWFVDSDTVPPPEALEKLLALGADIATGVTPILKDGRSFSNVFVAKKDGMWKTIGKEKSEALRAGASCLLIKREVLEKLNNPWFMTKWDENYLKYVSEDLYFCDKAVAEGFRIMADPSVQCRHWKEIYI